MESFDNRDQVEKFKDICSILAELWLNYKDEKEFSDFIQYSDLGLPLAFMLDSSIVDPTDEAVKYVMETWDLFLLALGVEQDIGWKSLEDLFKYVENKSKE